MSGCVNGLKTKDVGNSNCAFINVASDVELGLGWVPLWNIDTTNKNAETLFMLLISLYFDFLQLATVEPSTCNVSRTTY